MKKERTIKINPAVIEKIKRENQIIKDMLGKQIFRQLEQIAKEFVEKKNVEKGYVYILVGKKDIWDYAVILRHVVDNYKINSVVQLPNPTCACERDFYPGCGKDY